MCGCPYKGHSILGSIVALARGFAPTCEASIITNITALYSTASRLKMIFVIHLACVLLLFLSVFVRQLQEQSPGTATGHHRNRQMRPLFRAWLRLPDQATRGLLYTPPKKTSKWRGSL